MFNTHTHTAVPHYLVNTNLTDLNESKIKCHWPCNPPDHASVFAAKTNLAESEDCPTKDTTMYSNWLHSTDILRLWHTIRS